MADRDEQKQEDKKGLHATSPFAGLYSSPADAFSVCRRNVHIMAFTCKTMEAKCLLLAEKRSTVLSQVYS